MPCQNEEWAAENGESVEWARTMWWCECPRCARPECLPRFKATSGTCFSEQGTIKRHDIVLAPPTEVAP